MKRVTRAQLRGKPLDDDCRRYGKPDPHQYGEDDNRCFCSGIFNLMYEDLEDKCRACGAYSGNAEPPKEEKTMRLIDADALHKPVYADDDNITSIRMTNDIMDAYNDGINEAWRKIENAPTIDAVHVVRCEDCKHYKEGMCYNPNTYDDEKTCGNTTPRWFCADGERRKADD